MATIIVISRQQEGEYLPLGTRTSVIGRSESVALQILDDGVSRVHMRIAYDPVSTKYYIEDMDSRHGTLVNMRMIDQKQQLSEGDEILIGSTKLLFTERDFTTKDSALMHWKQVGEKVRTTRMEKGLTKGYA